MNSDELQRLCEDAMDDISPRERLHFLLTEEIGNPFVQKDIFYSREDGNNIEYLFLDGISESELTGTYHYTIPKSEKEEFENTIKKLGPGNLEGGGAFLGGVMGLIVYTGSLDLYIEALKNRSDNPVMIALAIGGAFIGGFAYLGNYIHKRILQSDKKIAHETLDEIDTIAASNIKFDYDIIKNAI